MTQSAADEHGGGRGGGAGNGPAALFFPPCSIVLHTGLRHGTRETGGVRAHTLIDGGLSMIEERFVAVGR